MIDNHLRALRENSDLHSSNYEKYVNLGDFNLGLGGQQIKFTITIT